MTSGAEAAAPPYDSEHDTRRHIQTVRKYLMEVVSNLYRRSSAHDKTKLRSPEKELYDRVTPRLRALEYSTDPDSPYMRELAAMGPALQHHYRENAHHPEHWEDGIYGMSLLDLLEMTADWKAAGERHGDGGDLMRSIAVNQERFGYSDDLRKILENTAEELGWA